MSGATKEGKKSTSKNDRRKKDTKLTDEIQQPAVSDKEMLLNEELNSITEELSESRKRVVQLRQENEWLQEESQRVRLENQEYMSYMDKKTTRRQTAVISLSDHHHKQILDLQQEQEKIKEEFNTNKQALLVTLMEKENKLAKVHRELDDLQEYKILQQEQNGQVHDLERQIMSLRGQHSAAIQQLKTTFLNEKLNFQNSSQAKIAETAKQANKEALICLNEHTERVRVENRQLRHELLTLIRKSQALHLHKRQLEQQRLQLLREKQYVQDLKAIRGVEEDVGDIQ